MPEECFDCPFYVQEPHDGEGCPACDFKVIFDKLRLLDEASMMSFYARYGTWYLEA